jgi:hypothetical protein
VRTSPQVLNVPELAIAMDLLSFVDHIPQVCHRCTCKLPKRAHFCPNCHVPQNSFDSDSLLQNVLLIVLTITVVVGVGWAFYAFARPL